MKHDISILPGTQERLQAQLSEQYVLGRMAGERKQQREQDEVQRHVSRKRRRIHLLWLLPMSLVAIASLFAIVFGWLHRLDLIFVAVFVLSVAGLFYHLWRADCHHKQLKKLSHPLRR